MKLTLLLACLWLDYYFDTGARWRNQSWFDQYVQTLKSILSGQKSIWGSPVAIAVILIPALIILAIIWSIAGRFSGIIELAIGFAVLWFCFAPTNLQESLTHYLKKDADPTKTEAEVRTAAGDLIGSDFYRSVSGLIFWQAHERFFGVIFWFLILGPVGALLFRMVSWMQETAPRMQEEFYPNYANNVYQIYWMIAWIPSRLAALSYTLTGNFLPGFDKWKNELLKADRCREVLEESGLAALTGENTPADREENLKAQGIVYRGLLIWVLVAAIATLGQAFIK